MSTRIAVDMVRAELLKLRRRRSVVGLALFFTVGTVVLFFGVSAIQHASNPNQYAPAGGLHNYNRAIELLSVFFGSLAAILVGTEAGAGDLSNGVFRDLVVTGRSRLALFAVRLPAAVIVSWTVALLGLGISLAATYAFAGGQPTPGATFVLDSVLWVLAAQAVLTAVAVGLGSWTGSRAATLVTLIGWQVIANRLLSQITFFGRARDILPDVALGSLKPGDALPDINGLTMSAQLAVIVLVLWAVVWLGVGAWRTQTRDA
jgi:ABC-type transport system involved in multi-copper enzyme maturation permease subunit